MSFLSSIEGGVVDRFAYVGGLTTQWIKGCQGCRVGSALLGQTRPLECRNWQMYAIFGGGRFRWSPSWARAVFMMAVPCATVLNQFGACRLVAEHVVTGFTKELGFLVSRHLLNGSIVDERSTL